MPIPKNKAGISVQVYPGAIRNEIIGFTNNVLLIKISAPPVKGKANREIIAFLSKLLGTKKESISIIKGYTNRNKVIVVDGLSRECALELLLTGKEA